MNDTFDNSHYEQLIKEHLNATKRVNKTVVSNNPETLARYKTDILKAHNDLVAYASNFIEEFDADSRTLVKKEITSACDKTAKAFEKLELSITLPENIFDQIIFEEDPNHDERFESAHSSTSSNSTPKKNTQSDTSEEKGVNNTLVESRSTNIEQNLNGTEKTATRSVRIATNMSDNEGETVENKVIEENRKLIKFASTSINRYNGNPLTLAAFINSIDLVRAATAASQMKLLKTIVVSRLEAKALECVDPNKDLDGVIADLKKSIKSDSSEVVEGRMQALRMNKCGPIEFAKQAETLADALQRSLVLEGITLEKAKQITVKRTIEMCKQTARSDYVKSILASTAFTDPKEVVSKLIVEQNNQDKEKQILFYQRNNSNFQKRGFNRSNNGNFRKNNRFDGQSNNFNRGSRGNRGGGRGRFRNNQNRNNRRDYNVRVAENSDAPSVSRREINTPNEPMYTLERVSQQ